MTPEEIDALVNMYKTSGWPNRQELQMLINMSEEEKRIADLLHYFQGLLDDCADDADKEIVMQKIESLEARKLQCSDWIAAMRVEWRNPFFWKHKSATSDGPT